MDNESEVESDIETVIIMDYTESKENKALDILKNKKHVLEMNIEYMRRQLIKSEDQLEIIEELIEEIKEEYEIESESESEIEFN